MNLIDRALAEISDQMFHDAHHELWAHFGKDTWNDVLDRLVESVATKISHRPIEVEGLDEDRKAV